MKYIIVVICILLGINASAQENVIPSKILAAFEVKYPSAEDVEWKQKKETYQAEFFDFYQTIAIFNPEGIWMKTISLISEEDLPEIAYEHVDEYFEVSQILQVHKIEDNKLKVSYKVVILEDGEKTTLHFSEEGNLIK